jgi:hypothetical protein
LRNGNLSARTNRKSFLFGAVVNARVLNMNKIRKAHSLGHPDILKVLVTRHIGHCCTDTVLRSSLRNNVLQKYPLDILALTLQPGCWRRRGVHAWWPRLGLGSP